MNEILMLLVISFYIVSCYFDEVLSSRDQNIPSHLNDHKREVNDFQPLRIYLHFEESNLDLKIVKTVFQRAVERISQLLYVIPIKGPLLLERLSCEKKWISGENIGRCASIGSKYKGEFCQNKIDKFKIPEIHLQELRVFNFSGKEPIFSLPAGEGVSNANYILYLKSETKNWCQREHFHAYASCCRFDKLGRPIAGFVNFCPEILNSAQFDDKYIFDVAIHEIFHALGFSKEMFPKFCEHSHSCQRKKDAIRKDFDNIHRLVFPSVVHEMNQHFNCSDEMFGAPLETDENGGYGSHWDNYLMYGSIMAADIGEPGHTAIDRISLAVFADSGWYYVNYSAADPYFWGKGGGCGFGLSRKLCSKTDGLCDINLNPPSASHCDFLHQTSSSCSRLNENNVCGIYKADTLNDCSSHGINTHSDALNYQACFESKEYGEAGTLCAPYRCDLEYKIEIFVADLWLPCSYNTTVQSKNLTVFCPASSILCQYTEHKYRHLAGQTSSSSSDVLLSCETVMCFNMFVTIFIIVEIA